MNSGESGIITMAVQKDVATLGIELILLWYSIQDEASNSNIFALIRHGTLSVPSMIAKIHLAERRALLRHLYNHVIVHIWEFFIGVYLYVCVCVDSV